MSALRRAMALVLVAAAVPLGATGCGGSGGSANAGPNARVEVAAAASLRTAFEAIAPAAHLPAPAFSFAGSDVLAAQLAEGARPDVYAAANTVLPAQLHRAGRLERPVVFARNELVVAVPAGSNRVRTLADLEHVGVRLAIGAPSVPIGAYTREVLARFDPFARDAIEHNVASTEPDVSGVVGKLAEGAVDAGFVYRSDVRVSQGRLRAIALPGRLRPQVAYAAGVVIGAPHPAAARRFLRALVGPAGRRALRAAGFEVPPA